MLIKRPADIRSSEITDKKLYFEPAGVHARGRPAAGAAAGAGVFWAADATLSAAEPAPHGRKLENVKPSELSVTNEKANSWEQITTYNNFYEFGTDKEDRRRCYAKSLKTEPWTVVVEGECAKPAEYTLEDILKGADARRADLPAALRRGVVDGDSVGRLPAVRTSSSGSSRRRRRNSSSSTRWPIPRRCPASGRRSLRWPYIEGLRMDEAMHPLTILAVGLYGEVLPKQNGAPIRLIVPWKYGFKSAKSIVRIRFVERQPRQHLAGIRAAGIRLLFERQPDGRSPALDPGHRAPHRRVLPAEDAHVQRLRRTGRRGCTRDWT